MSKDVTEKVLKIMQLTMILNSTKTSRETTNDKPTVFFNFAGHVCMLMVTICSEGWGSKAPFKTPDKRWEVWLDEDAMQLDEIIDTLVAMIEEWGN